MRETNPTPLSILKSHTIYVECGTRGCDQRSMLSIGELLAKGIKHETLDDVVSCLKCSRCKQRNVGRVSIIWTPDCGNPLEHVHIGERERPTGKIALLKKSM